MEPSDAAPPNSIELTVTDDAGTRTETAAQSPPSQPPSAASTPELRGLAEPQHHSSPVQLPTSSTERPPPVRLDPQGIEMLRNEDSDLRESSAPAQMNRSNTGEIHTNVRPLSRSMTAKFTGSFNDKFKRSRTTTLRGSSLAGGGNSNRESPPPSPGTRSPQSGQFTTNGKFFVPGTPDLRKARQPNWVEKIGEKIGLSEAVGDALDGERLRLLRRDAPMKQSTGRIYMHRSGASRRLAFYDFFHVILGAPLWILLGFILSCYTFVILVFACLYLIAEDGKAECGIAPLGERPVFYNTFAFSMETLTTIGYGVPFDGYLLQDSRCSGVLILVYFEAMIFIILNAMMVGVLFARVASAKNRASQIIFSDKAVIRCVRNRFYFMLQVGEASFFKYHPVVEAHVRVYGVLHEEQRMTTRDGPKHDAPQGPERAFFQTRVMRLTNPNDELGGMLFMATPQVVSHRIDRWSPMFPPAARLRTSDDAHDGDAYHFPGLVFREADREVATDDNKCGDFDGPQTYMTSPSNSQSIREASIRAETSLPNLPMMAGPSGSRSDDFKPGKSTKKMEIPPQKKEQSPGYRRFSMGLQRAGTQKLGKEKEVIKRQTSQPLPSLPAASRSPSELGLDDSSHRNDDALGVPFTREASSMSVDTPSARTPCAKASSATDVHHSLDDSAIGGSDPTGRKAGERRRSAAEHILPATGNHATTSQLLEMRKLIKQHITRSHLEVVIIVEAIDPHSSNTFQVRALHACMHARLLLALYASLTLTHLSLSLRPHTNTQARHSYTSSDIVFDHSFEACMEVAADGQAHLRWDLFHKTKESPFNTAQIIGGAHS